MPFHTIWVQGITVWVVIKEGTESLGGTGPAWYYHGPQMTQGIAFPGPFQMPDSNDPYIRRVCSPIRSGGGGPYRMVRIRCESGVRIKIPESGFLNPNPYAFALLLVWFVDPDHVRIRNYLHFAFRWVFLMDPDLRIRIRVRVSPNSFRKILIWYFIKKIRSAPPFSGSVHVFYSLALIKKSGTRFEDWDADPGPWSGSARQPSPRYRRKARYRTAMDYGPGICIRVRIPYHTVRGRF